ncbi:flavin reductase [bacterium]|nr:flavin reductase [bacterium]
MKEHINVFDYAQQIMRTLPKGILLNTHGDKFNAMVISWGSLGIEWGMPVFTAYVRENRYTKKQLDKTGEFTLSLPLDGPDPKITAVCGMQSGHKIDKAQTAGLTLEEPEAVGAEGVREYPLTLECRVVYAQKQDPELLPEEIRHSMYPEHIDGSASGANCDAHTAYIGQIVGAYIITDK